MLRDSRIPRCWRSVCESTRKESKVGPLLLRGNSPTSLESGVAAAGFCQHSPELCVTLPQQESTWETQARDLRKLQYEAAHFMEEVEGRKLAVCLRSRAASDLL